MNLLNQIEFYFASDNTLDHLAEVTALEPAFIDAILSTGLTCQIKAIVERMEDPRALQDIRDYSEQEANNASIKEIIPTANEIASVECTGEMFSSTVLGHRGTALVEQVHKRVQRSVPSHISDVQRIINITLPLLLYILDREGLLDPSSARFAELKHDLETAEALEKENEAIAIAKEAALRARQKAEQQKPMRGDALTVENMGLLLREEFLTKHAKMFYFFMNAKQESQRAKILREALVAILHDIITRSSKNNGIREIWYISENFAHLTEADGRLKAKVLSHSPSFAHIADQGGQIIDKVMLDTNASVAKMQHLFERPEQARKLISLLIPFVLSCLGNRVRHQNDGLIRFQDMLSALGGQLTVLLTQEPAQEITSSGIARGQRPTPLRDATRFDATRLRGSSDPISRITVAPSQPAAPARGQGSVPTTGAKTPLRGMNLPRVNAKVNLDASSGEKEQLGRVARVSPSLLDEGLYQQSSPAPVGWNQIDSSIPLPPPVAPTDAPAEEHHRSAVRQLDATLEEMEKRVPPLPSMPAPELRAKPDPVAPTIPAPIFADIKPPAELGEFDDWSRPKTAQQATELPAELKVGPRADEPAADEDPLEDTFTTKAAPANQPQARVAPVDLSQIDLDLASDVRTVSLKGKQEPSDEQSKKAQKRSTGAFPISERKGKVIIGDDPDNDPDNDLDAALATGPRVVVATAKPTAAVELSKDKDISADIDTGTDSGKDSGKQDEPDLTPIPVSTKSTATEWEDVPLNKPSNLPEETPVLRGHTPTVAQGGNSWADLPPSRRKFNPIWLALPLLALTAGTAAWVLNNREADPIAVAPSTPSTTPAPQTPAPTTQPVPTPPAPTEDTAQQAAIAQQEQAQQEQEREAERQAQAQRQAEAAQQAQAQRQAEAERQAEAAQQAQAQAQQQAAQAAAEAARVKAAQEAAQAAKVAAEKEAAQKLLAEKQAQEQARKAAQAQAEAQRQAAQAQAQKQAAQVAAQQVSAAQQRAQAEARRKAEAERQAALARQEAQRRAAQLEAQRQQAAQREAALVAAKQAEARRRAEAERQAALAREEAQRRAAQLEAQRQQAAAQAAQQAEAVRRAQVARERAEQEAARQRQIAAQRAAEQAAARQAAQRRAAQLEAERQRQRELQLAQQRAEAQRQAELARQRAAAAQREQAQQTRPAPQEVRPATGTGSAWLPLPAEAAPTSAPAPVPAPVIGEPDIKPRR